MNKGMVCRGGKKAGNRGYRPEFGEAAEARVSALEKSNKGGKRSGPNHPFPKFAEGAYGDELYEIAAWPDESIALVKIGRRRTFYFAELGGEWIGFVHNAIRKGSDTFDVLFVAKPDKGAKSVGFDKWADLLTVYLRTARGDLAYPSAGFVPSGFVLNPKFFRIGSK